MIVINKLMEHVTHIKKRIRIIYFIESLQSFTNNWKYDYIYDEWYRITEYFLKNVDTSLTKLLFNAEVEEAHNWFATHINTHEYTPFIPNQLNNNQQSDNFSVVSGDTISEHAGELSNALNQWYMQKCFRLFTKKLQNYVQIKKQHKSFMMHVLLELKYLPDIGIEAIKIVEYLNKEYKK